MENGLLFQLICYLRLNCKFLRASFSVLPAVIQLTLLWKEGEHYRTWSFVFNGQKLKSQRLSDLLQASGGKKQELAPRSV